MMMDMRLTSRSEPGPEPEPSVGDDLDTGVTGLLRYRRLVIRVLLVIFLLLPAVALLRSHPLTGRDVFLILATLAFVVLVDRIVLIPMPEPGRYARWQWALVPIVFALGAALFAVGHMAWITPLAVASAGVGRITPDGRPTVVGLVGCTGIAVVISAATGLGYGNTIVAGAVVALGSLLAHSAERRNVLMHRLKESGTGPGAAPGAAAKGARGDATAPGARAGRPAGTGERPGPTAPVAGSGLAGLAERAARLGGTLSAGAGERGGFWLRVSAPLAGPAPAKAISEPGRERTPS
jgi:hypothetical protein